MGFCFFWEYPFFFFLFKDMLPSVASWWGWRLSLAAFLLLGALLLFMWCCDTFKELCLPMRWVHLLLVLDEFGVGFFAFCLLKELKKKKKHEDRTLLSFPRLQSHSAHDSSVWGFFCWTRYVKISLFPSPTGYMLWSFGFSLLIRGMCIDSFKTVDNFHRVSNFY